MSFFFKWIFHDINEMCLSRLIYQYKITLLYLLDND